MKHRFSPLETVMYGGHGACTLVEITQKDFGGEIKDYYVLRPAFSGSSVFYVPLDSEPLTSKLRAIKSAKEICEMIPICDVWEWIEDDRTRQNQIKSIIDGSPTDVLVSVYKSLYAKQKELNALGKKLRAADDRYMREIEKLLLEELSLVFEIQKDELIPFIFSQITLKAK